MGRALKPAAQRINRVKPVHGEYSTIHPHKNPAPKPPAGGTAEADAAWKAWWSDPVSQTWSEGERKLVELLYREFNNYLIDSDKGRVNPIKSMYDQLGLTKKGRRDARLAISTDEHAPQPEAKPVADELAKRRKRAFAADSA